MDQIRFNILWAHELRSGCPLVASGTGCSTMLFLNKWLRKWGAIKIPSRYFLPVATISFCRPRWGRPISEDKFGFRLSWERSYMYLDGHSKPHQSGCLFPNPRGSFIRFNLFYTCMEHGNIQTPFCLWSGLEIGEIVGAWSLLHIKSMTYIWVLLRSRQHNSKSTWKGQNQAHTETM